jgi:hypothetical protein
MGARVAHVRLMRKLGVANHTQVAMACANGGAAEMRADDLTTVKDRAGRRCAISPFGVLLEGDKV